MASLSEMTEKLQALVRERGELSHIDLLRFMEDENIGPILLDMILEELEMKGVIGVENRQYRLIDPDLEIYIPEKIVFTRKREAREGASQGILQAFSTSKVVRRKTSERKRPRRSRALSLTAFLQGTNSAETNVQATELLVETENSGLMQVSRPNDKEDLGEESYVNIDMLEKELGQLPARIIGYLSKYPSVGELRLIMDLMREKVAKEEREVYIALDKLLKMGFIEITSLGVVNATEKMPRVKVETRIQDIFGS